MNSVFFDAMVSELDKLGVRLPKILTAKRIAVGLPIALVGTAAYAAAKGAEQGKRQALQETGGY